MSPDRPLNVGVIGCGYFGRFHANKYNLLRSSHLAAVVDVDLARARDLANSYEGEIEALEDYRALVGRVDAVSICAPTSKHYEIVRFCLEHGLHVLVEKPITETVAQAQELAELERQTGLVLQIGHQQRFNPAFAAARAVVKHPVFIECRRLGMLSDRSADVCVVLDLMIHDLDLTLSLIPGEVERVSAIGTSVINETVDIAHAHLEFSGGEIACLTASRISTENQVRLMEIFEPQARLSVDLLNNKTTYYHVASGENYKPETARDLLFPSGDDNQEPEYRADELDLEIHSFIEAIQQKSPAIVNGRHGVRTLELANRINETIRTRQQKMGAAPWTEPK